MTQKTESPEWQTKYSPDEYAETGFMFDVESAYAYFERVKDRRKVRGRQYPLAVALVLCLLVKLSGENTPAGIADWVKLRSELLCERLGIKRRIVKETGKLKMPCAGSYSRILSKSMDADDLETVSQEFFGTQPATATAVEICIDGKKVRGTITASKPDGDYPLAAYMPGAGVVLMQVVIKAGESELTVAPEVLKVLDLQGKVVTGDALFAQRNLSIQIVEAGGDYAWKVKGNQPTLERDIARVFEPDPPSQQAGL
ncbi:MAG: ISAs1 family transposase [Chloroflexi bacterium]|nr:ISAs1 family transposase [Chloroflexota bacterium]